MPHGLVRQQVADGAQAVGLCEKEEAVPTSFPLDLALQDTRIGRLTEKAGVGRGVSQGFAEAGHVIGRAEKPRVAGYSPNASCVAIVDDAS